MYGLIVLSVVMFGGCFALKDIYRQKRGEGLMISLEFSLVAALAGAVVLFIINAANGIFWEFTPFAFLMAALSALNGFGFTFCSFKALGKINLSLYSLFSMLGGMLLPFLQGLIFYGEKMTVAKGVCFALITAALLLAVKWKSIGKSGKKSGVIYYIGVFALNGMSGVLSKIFTSAPAEMQTGATSYSLLSALISAFVSVILLLALGRRMGYTKTNPIACTVAAASGTVNRLANLFLVIALASGVDNTVQYPMVTGGVMIISTLIAFFGKNKPSRTEVASIAIAFLGTLALFVIPI